MTPLEYFKGLIRFLSIVLLLVVYALWFFHTCENFQQINRDNSKNLDMASLIFILLNIAIATILLSWAWN